MATYHELLTLSDTTPTEITPGPNHSGLDVTVQNVDPAANVYVGKADVTASDYGFKIVPGGAFSVELNPADQTKALRFNYAGRSYYYDETRDAFIPPKPFESWVLDEATCLWHAPIPYPADGGDYVWNEETISWDLVVSDS